MEKEPFDKHLICEVVRYPQIKHDLNERLLQQAAVARLGQRALAVTDLSTLMNETVRLVAETMQVDFCMILKVLPEGQELLLVAGVGWKEGATGATRVSSRNESQAGYTLMVNEPVTVFDLMSETRFTGSPLLHEHGVVSGMSVLISGKERPFGVLGVHTKHWRIFSLDDTNFLLSVANVLASAIERQHNELSQRLLAEIRDITERKLMQADLMEVQRRLIDSVEAERLRLSQELHDGPIQELYGITYQLSDLASTNFSEANQMEKFHSNIESTTQMVKRVVELLRSICGDLRPPSLAPFGLEKAIRAHIDEISEKYPNLSIRLDLMPDGQTIPERVRLALFRICQHAVSNVIRHSEATNLTVQFSYDPEQVLLGIEDDGCGFELPTSWIELARSGHLGLSGTAERVEAIGGQLQIISAPGKGTVIQITAPLKQEASEHFVHSGGAAVPDCLFPFLCQAPGAILPRRPSQMASK